MESIGSMRSAISRLGPPPGFRCDLAGHIASAAFTSGHRFVVGLWNESPLGPMNDVMWARPDGTRALLVPRPEVGEFISAVYQFDDVERVPFETGWDGPHLRVSAGPLSLTMTLGRERTIPLAALRKRPAVRWIEAPLVRWLLGVRTFGTSPTGIFEWYRADQYRAVVEGHASLTGTDLGSLCRFQRPTGFGFSEPPRRPSVVRVRPMLIDPSGVLARMTGSR